MDKFLLFVLLVCSFSVACHGGPIHASCKIKWSFGISCDQVLNKLKQQINTWSGDDCGTGEKCLYKLISATDTELKATHTTPKKHYVDDLTFTLTSGDEQKGSEGSKVSMFNQVFGDKSAAACSVQGHSTSETWYAILDYGTNYCNLHNLIIGSGLDKAEGYTETTSDSVCTQFSSADCDTY